MRASFCFSVHAESSPASLPRVVDVLALRGLVPQSCYSRLAGDGQDDLVIDLELDEVTALEAAAIAKRLGRVVTVRQVLWSQKIRRAAA
jgi:hypothetical protein